MARPLGSGPIHVYVGFGPPTTITVGALVVVGVGPTSAAYYGTTREGPDIEPEIANYPIMNDLTGPRLSLDEGYAGREDIITLTMTSRQQGVDNILENPANYAAPVLVVNGVVQLPALAGNNGAYLRGNVPLTALGTMMMSEGRSYGLWLVKMGATKLVNSGTGMPLGRYYPTCLLRRHKPIEGNRENMVVTTFAAKNNIAGINTNQFPLFFENDASFVGLPLPYFG